MLHTLYQQNVKARTNFFVEWMALDLIRDADGDVVGVTALEMETGRPVHPGSQNRAVRHGRRRPHLRCLDQCLHQHRRRPWGMAARAGIPLQDMEFWQFHPTGVAGAGVLLTEGCRGEGAILLNSNGERFMERYAPTLKDLAPRDFVSRSMDQEIKEGRGCGPNKDYVLLKLDHLGAETIHKRLPSVYEIGVNFANVDITKEPIPVVPTIHYQMGGIPTNVNGQVVTHDGTANRIVNGLYAVGEMRLRERARRQPPGHQTRCWTYWCSARPLAATSWSSTTSRRPTSHCPRTLQTARWNASTSSKNPPAASMPRPWLVISAPPCSSTLACSAPRPAWMKA
jgi:succinate dehydrogenase / fumarate reductase flavoprotein subunit